MKVSLVIASLFASAFAAPSFVSQYELDGSSRHEGGSIIDKLRECKQFSRFVEVLDKEKGLRDELEDRGRETTVFAPTNDAMRKIEDEWRKTGEKIEMRDVLKYHIAGDSKISQDCMHQGALVPTNLRLKSLDDRHQRIRVFRFGDTVFLNMKAQIVEADIKADNGRIHAIDHVLCPPRVVTETMYSVPTKFSTTLAGLERTGLIRDVNRERGVTFFAPTNVAWKSLGPQNLRWLFSCWGQVPAEQRGRNSEEETECEGTKTLKKILRNHVAKELAYATDIAKKQSMKFETLGGEKLEVCAKEKQGRRHTRDSRHEDVRDWNFVVNNGEARVTFTDGLGSNGAIQAIDNVLTSNVELPYDRFGA